MRNVFRVCVYTCLFMVYSSAHAATLYIDPNEETLSVGDTKIFSVRVDTEEEECINVIDGVLHYSDNILPVDIALGDSILPFWVEQPRINKDSRTITFAGGIPNGYCGRIDGDPRLTNIILEVVVQLPSLDNDAVTEAFLSFGRETAVYLNDGTGTKTKLVTLDPEIILREEPEGEIVNEWNERIENDTIPPNSFSISLESDPSIFNGKYFIVFNTTDKQSGIDHYEIMEESLDNFNVFTWGGVGADWKVVRSPYKLNDQSLNSTIRVKAIDKAGNEYIAVYVPEEGMRGVSIRQMSTAILGTLGFLILLGLIIAFLVYLFRTRNQTGIWNDDHEDGDREDADSGTEREQTENNETVNMANDSHNEVITTNKQS